MSHDPVRERGALDEATPGGSGTYRPHLDGVRALAVYLVVAFHAGIGAVEGGFIGVDVFFVLSGYLVTSVLLAAVDADGAASLPRFYARRVRRLLPAAALTLVVTAAVWSRLVTGAEVSEVAGGFRAAFLYVSNWWFLSETSGYFAADVDTNPILHFWSLSIEEQFYIVWPLVLLGGMALARRWRPDAPRTVLRTVVVVLGAASLSWGWYLSREDVSRAYYGTDARVYQLLAGAALALTAHRGAISGPLGRGLAPVAVVGLLAASTPVLDLDPFARGVVATVLTVALLVGLERGNRGPTTAALSAAPIAALGRISYGTYLWHWPIVVIARLETDWGAPMLLLVSGVGATVLAAISARVLERPIRVSPRLDARPRAVVAVGLTVSVVCGVLIVPVLEGSRGATGEVVVEGAGVGAQPVTLDWEGAFNDAAPNHACPTSEDISPCHLHEGSGLRVLVLGDSEVWSFTPTLRELAAEEDWDLWEGASGGCPWEYGLQHESLIGDAEALADGCAEMQERWWTQFVAAVDPDLVVGIRAPREDPVAHVSARLDGGDWIGWTYSSDSEYWDTIETAIDRSVAALRGEGRRLLILEPFPITGPFATPDPRQCLSDVRTVADLDDCAYPASAPNLPIEVLYRAAAESDPGVRTLDLDRFFCPDGETCPAAIDGVVVRRDWLHPTASFVDLHRDVLRDAINAAGDAPG